MSRQSSALRAAVFVLFICLAGASAADTPAITTPTGPVQVLRITPDGSTQSYQRQVTVQFDRPMVVLGSVPPKLDKVPVDITPALGCNWHWVNTSTLTCELGERSALPGPGPRRHHLGSQVEQGGLAPATSYQVTVHAGIKAVDGSALAQDVQAAFTTEVPAGEYAYLVEWSGPVQPVLQVEFNLPVTKSSVEAHLYFDTAEGRVPVSAMADPQDGRDYYVLPAGGGDPVHVPGKPVQVHAYSEDEGGGEGDDAPDAAESAPAAATQAAASTPPPPAGEAARYRWLISVRPGAKALPGGQQVELEQEAGLATPLGTLQSDASKELLAFYTYGEFSFLGVNCGDYEGAYEDGVLKDASQPSCDPQRYVSLVFTSPVHADELKAHVQARVNGKAVDPIGEVPTDQEWSMSQGRESQSFRVFFAVPLKAAADYSVQVSPGMKDVWGRPLRSGGSAGFHTEHRNPGFNLEDDVAVLEKGVDSEVPMYLTNLKSLSANYTTLTAAQPGHGTLDYKLPGVEDLAVGMPVGVRGMLGGYSGVVDGNLMPVPSDRDRPYHFFAEVTPFDVQVKVGHYNTLVWVADFATGQPVAGAQVSIYPGESDLIAMAPQNPATAVTDASGIAMLPGGRDLDPDMTLRQPHYGQPGQRELMVKVSRGADLALLPLDYQFEVNTYAASHNQVWEALRKKYGHMRAWGTTAEGIYRAGDTIQYKIYVRDQDNRTLVPPPDATYKVTLEDPMGNVVYAQDKVKLSEFGAYDGQYPVPQSAPVGWYSFYIASDDLAGKPASADEDTGKPFGTLQPMKVLVSDFTPAPFHVDASLNGASFQPGDKVEVTTSARLHSGGPYTDAQGRITVTLKAEDFSSGDSAAQGFSFSSYDATGNQSDQTVNETTGAVDATGTLKADFELQDAGVYYGKLLVEGDVRDERGKYIAAVTRADYLGRDRFVGLRMHGWVLTAGQSNSVDYLAVDGSGRPVAGAHVKIGIERLDLKASRVKGPGNAYLTQYARSWVAAGGCEAVSAAAPASCSFTPGQPGEYRIKASVIDTHGRVHQSSLPAWAAGKGEVVWEDHDDGALTLVAEKPGYHVGDIARYMVQNPYPGAKALISIERYGVLKSWVQTLEGSTPVISFPVEQDYLPGFYLSVTVMSPRVAKPLGPDQVDLGKPAFRSGYLQVQVVDDYKVLDVKVSTPKDSYKPRDSVTVSVSAKARHGQAGKVEFAVAVLDDSVFDLISDGKDYFDPYKGFYKLDGLDLMNYNLITRLVGRQAFEKKGATPGGDGGAALSLRSLFKFVSYWNPSLRADAKGDAKFSFTVPDNLTGWRVLVLAVDPGDRMGLGQGTFKVNRPTELRPVMPNQVVEGDKFTAGFSVMNRTDKPRDLKVHIGVKGQVEGAPVLDQVVHVDPYKRAELWLPVAATGPGSMDFTATAGDASDSDGLKQSVPVKPMTTMLNLAQYGTATAAAREPVQYPSGAVTGSVQLGVNLAPTVIGNLQGAFAYMSEYPYECWEQRLTKAVMAANFERLQVYLGKSAAWPGSRDIPAATLGDAAAFQAPSGGMVYWVADDRYVDPYLSAYTALAFNWLRAQGYAVPAAVEQRLHAYLQNFLKGEGAPDYYTLGMRSSVRAVALAALAADHEASLDDLRRFEPALKEMSLFGQSWFLQAALDLGGRDLASEDLKLILNHSNETGGKFEFSESLDDGYNRILSTPLRSNCTILSALSRYARSGQVDAGVIGEVPFKLVRSITQIRGGKDHWENTQENLFCMQALADYAQAYEQTAPQMHLAVQAGADQLGAADFRSVRDPAVTLSHALAPAAAPVTVDITPTGAGRYYYRVQLTYAPKELPGSVNDGIEIHREYSVQRGGRWLLLKSPMVVTRGELVRVDLYVSVPAAREFVVVDDPVPGGLEPVDRNLATSSTRDAEAGAFQAAGGAFWFNFDDWEDYGVQFWDFYHQELRHDSARFYSDYLPGGHYHLSYSAQAIASGVFAVQPPKAEEMYDPDVFGLDASAVLQVNDPAPPGGR
ncbi:MAG TPA: MG2 domain-containing protein [Gammaproteobacteria bacterium]|nr:MG2 domain-containing protein [Gammaproteobacteria bacterium]